MVQDTPSVPFCYCQLVNPLSPWGILSYSRSANTKHHSLLICSIWGRFHSVFPGDLSTQQRAEVDVNNVMILFLSSQSRCLNGWNGSHPQSVLPAPSTKETTGELCRHKYLSSISLKSEGTTSMLHVEGENLVLVVSCSLLHFYLQVPLLWIRCRLFWFFFSLFCWIVLHELNVPCRDHSRGTGGNEAVICMRDNRSAECTLLWEEGGGCSNKTWKFILHIWSVLITQLFSRQFLSSFMSTWNRFWQ